MFVILNLAIIYLVIIDDRNSLLKVHFVIYMWTTGQCNGPEPEFLHGHVHYGPPPNE